MKDHIINKAHRFATTIISTGLVLVMISLFLIFGPTIESRLFPVTKDVRVELITSNKDEVLVSVYGTKVRPCKYIETHAIVLKDGVWVKGDMTFSTATENNNPTRGLGAQHFGYWTIKPEGNPVRLEVVNKCHEFWDTVTSFGTWDFSADRVVPK